MAASRRDRPHRARGIDAPGLLAVPVVAVAYGVVQGALTASVWPFIGAGLVVLFSGIGFYASRWGKFVVWTRLLDHLGLAGNEHILDIGCGRGAVLMLAAQHLRDGRAVGLDLWRKGDQSGNEEAATRRNATAEGVADRVDVQTGDMTSLPFAADSFDVVVSNLAVHNVKTQAGRR